MLGTDANDNISVLQWRLNPTPTWGAMFESKNVSSIASYHGSKQLGDSFSTEDGNIPERILHLPQEPYTCGGAFRHWHSKRPKFPHVTPVISTPEVILQFGTKRDWERLILFEYRGGAVAFLAIGNC
jgi:hypothetical protein